MCQDLGKSYEKYERELEGILQKDVSPHSSIVHPHNDAHVERESVHDSDEFFDEDVNVLLS